MNCIIVAEAGINHGGSLKLAIELANAAKNAGADAVKYQIFIPEKSLNISDHLYNRVANAALSFDDFLVLSEHCRKIDIEFFATPECIDTLRFLVEECGVKRIKIGSGSLTYRPLVRSAFATGLPVILSTGMATSYEVQSALMDAAGPEKVTLLHCVSLYPTPNHLVNLRAMDSLRVFGTKVGYSDHRKDTLAVIAAASMGAEVIEKHFVLGDTDDAIDQVVSIGPVQFSGMVKAIRNITELRGDGIKRPSEEERAMIARIRKGDDGRQPGL